MNAARRQAYIETDDVNIRIVKGDAFSEWTAPYKVCTLDVDNGRYWAFSAPLMSVLEPFEPNTVYFSTKVRSKERKVREL
jgi:hypothetical protein